MVKFYCRKDRRRYKLEDLKTKCHSCELGHGCNAYAPVMRLTGAEDLQPSEDNSEDTVLKAVQDVVFAAALRTTYLRKQQNAKQPAPPTNPVALP